MSNPLPASLALANIADGAAIVAADHRNNYTQIQAAVNALVAALSGGTAGQLLSAADGSDVQYIDAPSRTLQRYVGNPIVTVSNNTETDLFGSAGSGYQLLGNLLGTSHAVTVRVVADVLNNTGSTQTLAFKAYYGASSVAADTLSFSTNTGRTTVQLDVQLTALAATNAQLLTGTVIAPNSTAKLITLPLFGATGAQQGVLAIDSTHTQNLRVTVTNGITDAQLVCRSFLADIKLVQ